MRNQSIRTSNKLMHKLAETDKMIYNSTIMFWLYFHGDTWY